MMREKIKTLKDTIPWPPDVHDLDTSKINITGYLDLFMSTLLSGCSMESSSGKVNRLKLPIGQDLVYATSNGRIKTPKSILYPYAIKSLTNSTRLITINNQLGHGVSASILEELAAENAFRVLEFYLSFHSLFSKTIFQEGNFSEVLVDYLKTYQNLPSFCKIFFILCKIFQFFVNGNVPYITQ